MDGTLLYPLDWKCLYPPKCTRAVLVAKLREMAAHWQGWEDFAWYLTRTLHRHIDGPPMDWDHLHTFFWIQGYAAHVILNERFENRNAVLDLLMRHEVQFVGILRHMVVDQIRWCLIFTKQARLPDCALWGADTPENRQAVAEKREGFREGIEQAVAEFVRVLNFASAMEDVNARIAGHPLRAWFRGAHMPEATEIPVRIVEEDGRVHLAPDAQTAARFMSRRLPVPRIEVGPEGGGEGSGFGVQGGRQEAEGSGFGVQGEVSAVVKVIGDFKVIRVGKVEIDLSGKHKARAFLRFLHKKVSAAGTQEFYVEEVREEFNAAIPETRKGRRWLSDRFREDLFKDRETDFDLLFETMDRAAGHYRLRV